MKKFILIATPLLILIIFGLWFIFGRNPAPSAGPSNTTPTSPFGSGEGALFPTSESTPEGAVSPLPASVGSETSQHVELFKLSSSPVAGFVVLSRGSTTAVRYADRGTGNIFEVLIPAAGVSPDKTRLTNNTVPQVYEAYFRSDGKAAVLRTLTSGERVKNLSVSIASSTSSASFVELRGNMINPSVGIDDTLFYFLKDSQAIVSSKFNGEGVKTLWKTPALSWRTAPLGKSLLVFTAPSASLPGLAYSVNAGALTKLAGPLNGLAAIGSASGKNILYSANIGGVTKLFSKNITKSVAEEVSPGTLAEKCVWSSKHENIFLCGAPSDGIQGGEPDNWYQGKSHFNDSIWTFDTLSGTADLTLDPKERFGISLDVYNPALSADENYFVFMNKGDLTLWAVKLR